MIFDLPEADMGCHPADENGGDGKSSGTHDISFYCDDIEHTVGELRARGVEFTKELRRRNPAAFHPQPHSNVGRMVSSARRTEMNPRFTNRARVRLHSGKVARYAV